MGIQFGENLSYTNMPAMMPKTYQSSQMRFYLNVPFAEKDEAKVLGARWDGEKKQWYFTDPSRVDFFSKWMPDKGDVELSDEQIHVIESAKKGLNILVDACIGSGKTTTIQQLCNELPNKEILYLTYNRLLKEDAKKKIHAGNVTVTNYHGFAYGILTKLGQLVSPNDAVDRFNETKPVIPHYDILVLDEYQDIDEAISQMLWHIKDENPNIQIIAVGDMAQKIYDRTTIDIQKFMNAFLETRQELNFSNCYRLSADHASHLGQLWGKEINGVNPKCQILEMRCAEVVRFLHDKEPKDILCLGPRGDSDLTKVLNILERKYPDKFNKQTVYASIRDEERSQAYNQDSAIFTTYDGSKGMERKYCIVFGFTEDYWDLRINQPAAKYDVTRNLFLVAASRGKEQIVFVRNEEDYPLSDKTILTVPDKEYKHPKPFNASDMYDFNYEEHIKACLALIKKRKIEVKDKSEITVKTMDDNTLEEKILKLVAYDTKQKRYIWQVKPPLLSDEQKEQIHKRLATVFKKDETVQEECKIIFADSRGNNYEIHGLCDVVKDERVYELKFTTALSDQHFLQTAFYICAMGYKSGYLWNIRTNEIYQIMVPERKQFLNATVNSITKGNVRSSGKFMRTKRIDE